MRISLFFARLHIRFPALKYTRMIQILLGLFSELRCESGILAEPLPEQFFSGPTNPELNREIFPSH